jgi:hypothetical protein
MPSVFLSREWDVVLLWVGKAANEKIFQWIGKWL